MLSVTVIVASALIGALSSAFPFALIVLASAAALLLSCTSGVLAGEPAEALMRSGLSALLLVEVGYMLGASIQIFWHGRNEPSARDGETLEASGPLRPSRDGDPA